jgi:hypothetical protein
MARLIRFYSELTTTARLGVKQRRATTTTAQSPEFAQTTMTTNTRNETKTPPF